RRAGALAPRAAAGPRPSTSRQGDGHVRGFDREHAVARPVVRRVAAEQLELDRVAGREPVAVAVQLEDDRPALAFLEAVDPAADEALFTARKHVPQPRGDLSEDARG